MTWLLLQIVLLCAVGVTGYLIGRPSKEPTAPAPSRTIDLTRDPMRVAEDAQLSRRIHALEDQNDRLRLALREGREGLVQLDDSRYATYRMPMASKVIDR